MEHVPDTGLQYESRVAGPIAAASTGFSIPPPSSGSTRHARHRPAEVQDRRLRARMLLASPSRLQIRVHTEVSNRFLAGEIRYECRAGSPHQKTTHRGRLDGGGGLGVDEEGSGEPVEAVVLHLQVHRVVLVAGVGGDIGVGP